MNSMILMVVPAMFAFAGEAVSQGTIDEERLAELNEQLKDDWLSGVTGEALAHLRGNDILRLLELQLEDRYRPIDRICDVFRRMGDHGRQLLPGLVDVFNGSQHTDKRLYALELLAEIAPWREGADKYLAEHLAEIPEGIQFDFARAKLNARLVLDPKNEELSTLTQLLDLPEADPFLRRLCAQALAERGPAAYEALPTLVRALEASASNPHADRAYHSDGHSAPVRITDAIAEAILSIDPQGASAVVAHAHRLRRSHSSRHRVESVVALGKDVPRLPWKGFAETDDRRASGKHSQGSHIPCVSSRLR